MTTAQASVLETPAGPFTVGPAEGVVIGAGWTPDHDGLFAPVAPALRPAGVEATPPLGSVPEAVQGYVDGSLHVIDDIPVRQQSGPYLQHAWDVLRTVPAG